MYSGIKRKAQDGQYQHRGQSVLILCQAAEQKCIELTEQEMLDILKDEDLFFFGIGRALEVLDDYLVAIPKGEE